MRADAQTLGLLRQRLEVGPAPDERPGGLGLLAVAVGCRPGEAAPVLAAVRTDLLAAAQGTRRCADLPDLEADWMLWSMAVCGDDEIRVWLEVSGFPVSGFSSLRDFFVARGALSVEQRPREAHL